MPVIFKSRRFWVSIVGLVVLIVSSLAPELEVHLNVIAPSAVAIIGVLISGYTVEDSVQAHAAGKVEAAKASAAK